MKRLVRVWATVSVLASSAASAQWSVNEARDSITDRTEVTAELRGEGGRVVFMCSAGQRPVVLFHPDAFLGGPISGYDWRDFTYRVDASAAVTTRWKYSNGYATAPSEREMASFLGALAHGDTLRIRAIRYDRTSVDASFSLSGTADAMRRAVAACGGGGIN